MRSVTAILLSLLLHSFFVPTVSGGLLPTSRCKSRIDSFKKKHGSSPQSRFRALVLLENFLFKRSRCQTLDTATLGARWAVRLRQWDRAFNLYRLALLSCRQKSRCRTLNLETNKVRRELGKAVSKALLGFETTYPLPKQTGPKKRQPPFVLSIHFSSRQGKLHPVSKALLRSLEASFRAAMELTKGDLQIQGHTGSRGSRRYNQRISQVRANSAKQFLVSLGLPRHRIKAMGRGESRLLSRRRNSFGQAINQRIEFQVTFKTK